MFNRKQYLIDKKLQLGMTFSILAVVLIVSAVIITSLVFSIAYNNEDIEDVLKVQEHIVHFLKSRISVVENDSYKETLENISRNHTNNINTLKQIIRYNKILLIAIILFIIIQGIILFILGIKRTHRISGPIYVMTNYIKDIIDGKEPDKRSLRQKDELKDFFELLKEMVEKLKR